MILDLALPKREGYDVLQAIRERGSKVPVIVLTGHPDLSDAVACLDVGASDYMTKPFRFEELLAPGSERGFAWPERVSRRRSRSTTYG